MHDIVHFNLRRKDEDRSRVPARQPLAVKAALRCTAESSNIEDYLLNSRALDCGGFKEFDRDFISSEALQIHAKTPSRKMVTRASETDALIRILDNMIHANDRLKYVDRSTSRVATLTSNVMVSDKKRLGISTDPARRWNEHGWISVSIIDELITATGVDVKVAECDADGGTSMPTAGSHPRTYHCTVAGPATFSESA